MASHQPSLPGEPFSPDSALAVSSPPASAAPSAASDPGDPPDPRDPDAPRERHDAFTEARKRGFLAALAKTGCVLDACRATGVAPRTVYRHQESDARFAENCRIALAMAATPVELTAWSRAVEGVEQEFACGGEVHVRRRYDTSLLRLLLQGSNPKKYGPRPGFKRKRLLKAERRQIEREVRAELDTTPAKWSLEESLDALERSLEIYRLRRAREAGEEAGEEAQEKLAAGWTRTEEGYWIPPGYGPIPGWTAPSGCGGAGDPP